MKLIFYKLIIVILISVPLYSGVVFAHIDDRHKTGNVFDDWIQLEFYNNGNGIKQFHVVLKDITNTDHEHWGGKIYDKTITLSEKQFEILFTDDHITTNRNLGCDPEGTFNFYFKIFVPNGDAGERGLGDTSTTFSHSNLEQKASSSGKSEILKSVHNSDYNTLLYNLNVKKTDTNTKCKNIDPNSLTWNSTGFNITRTDGTKLVFPHGRPSNVMTLVNASSKVPGIPEKVIVEPFDVVYYQSFDGNSYNIRGTLSDGTIQGIYVFEKPKTIDLILSEISKGGKFEITIPNTVFQDGMKYNYKVFVDDKEVLYDVNQLSADQVISFYLPPQSVNVVINGIPQKTNEEFSYVIISLLIIPIIIAISILSIYKQKNSKHNFR